MMIDSEQFIQFQESDAAWLGFQQSVLRHKAFPSDENRLAALEKHQKWQGLFLALPLDVPDIYRAYKRAGAVQ